jgi:hypothetical protein
VADDRPTPFKKGTRVVATTDLPGVPEGTAGRIGVGAGLVTPRYWVEFENGVEMGSIIHKRLVREKDWPAFQAARDQAAAAEAERAARAAERAAAAEQAAADGDAAAEAGEATADAEGDGGEKAASAASPADDRLAALMARSKAARAAKTE